MGATPWLKGWPATPYGVDQPPTFFFFFFFNKGWLDHPLRPWGWPTTPCGVDWIPTFFFFFLIGGGRSTPLGQGGGSATPKPAPRGWLGHPPWALGVVRPPLFCF
jgi:hypothetical protein